MHETIFNSKLAHPKCFLENIFEEHQQRHTIERVVEAMQFDLVFKSVNILFDFYL